MTDCSKCETQCVSCRDARITKHYEPELKTLIQVRLLIKIVEECNLDSKTRRELIDCIQSAS